MPHFFIFCFLIFHCNTDLDAELWQLANKQTADCLHLLICATNKKQQHWFTPKPCPFLGCPHTPLHLAAEPWSDDALYSFWLLSNVHCKYIAYLKMVSNVGRLVFSCINCHRQMDGRYEKLCCQLQKMISRHVMSCDTFVLKWPKRCKIK